MKADNIGERLIGELFNDPQRFDEAGRAYDLLQAYFSELPVDTLRPLLQSDNIWIQRTAAFVAAELGARSRPLIDDVVPLLKSRDRHVQDYAMQVLTVCCDGEHAGDFGHVVKKLESDDEGLRLQAMDLVANADVAQLEAAARFLANEPSGETHQRGLRALATVEQAAPDMIRALADDPDPLVQRYGSIAEKRLSRARARQDRGTGRLTHPG
jgi:hypothetical protein